MRTFVCIFIASLFFYSSNGQSTKKQINKLNGVRESFSYQNNKKIERVKYDRNGSIIESYKFNSYDEKIEFYYKYYYNSKGQNDVIIIYNAAGVEVERRRFEYDDNDMILSSIYMKSSGSQYTTYQKRRYEYNNDLLQKIYAYENNNALQYTFVYEYNNGLVQTCKRENKIGNPEYIWTYTYESNGLEKSSIGEDLKTKRKEITTYSFIAKPVTEEIREIVQRKINEWQKKGLYEKTNDFQSRVTEKTRNELINKLTKHTIDSLANLYDWKILKKDYDADNETYKIVFSNFGSVYINVPSGKVKEFDKNINKLKFENPQFSISNNFFSLTSLTIKNKKDIYTFNTNEQIAFNPSDLNFVFNSIEIDLPNQKQNVVATTIPSKPIEKSDVDINIPTNKRIKQNAYALIIGNEDYSSFQVDLRTESNVDFASNDANVFKDYCIKTLGIPEKQTKLLINATAGQMNQSIAWLINLIKIENGNAEIYFYYSGHGLPDENTKEPYLIPVDISGYNANQGVSLNSLYKNINEYPSKKVTFFIDACFSGGARNQGLISMKGVKVRPKENIINGNMVVFSSSTGEESSGVLNEKQHGYMTYFLLKKIQETKGDISYKELANYIIESVRKESALKGKIQTPQLNYSPDVINIWENWKLE